MIGALVAGITGSGGASLSSYESIATATATGTTATLSFSSIPSTYKHLQIRGIARNASSVYYTSLYAIFNSDSGANYADHQLRGDGASVVAAGSANTSQARLGEYTGTFATADCYSAFVIDILDYASTSKNKTVRTFSGLDTNDSNASRIFIVSSLWRDTSAINSITIRTSGVNFVAGSTFALYGIKEA